VDPQLEAIIVDLNAARRRVEALAALPRVAWTHRPGPDAWSATQCLAHLNLTSEAILPLMAAGLIEARKAPRRAPVPYRRDAVGWAIWMAMAPEGGVKIKTVPTLEPPPAARFDLVAARFDELQAAIVAQVGEAEGLAIDQVQLPSPFDPRVTYNLYAIFTLTPRHQHRHLQQAERAVEVFTELRSGRRV
jgi:hypothetical protein